MLITLANGGVLSAIYHDFPESMRPAARRWGWATLLVALGLAALATDTILPHLLVIILSNGCLLAGLTIYYLSIRRFHNLPPNSLVWLPSFLGMIGLIYYAVILPSTIARILIISVVWVLLMSATIVILLDKKHRDGSRSRMMLASMYIIALLVTVARAVFYLSLQLGSVLNITDNTHWMNTASPIFLAVLPVIGTTAFMLLCTDQIRRRWEYAASRDYLTNLPNRRTLTEFGIVRINKANKQKTTCAVAVLDIDNFKLINDTHGHEIGDQVLKHVAARLQTTTWQDDFVARSGGEEFVIIFGEISSQNAEAATERIREAIEENPFVFNSIAIPVTVSIGLTVQASGALTLDDILRRADKALYIAKSSGRNRIEVV